MICGKCGKEISDTAKFCPKCGAPQAGTMAPEPGGQKDRVRNCPSCGAGNPLSARFCRVDGHALSACDTYPAPVPDVQGAGNGLVCPACGTENPPAAKFCKKDGTPLAGKIVFGGAGTRVEEPQPTEPCQAPGITTEPGNLICATCGASNPPEAKFCRKDGTRLQGGVPVTEHAPPVEPSGDEDARVTVAPPAQKCGEPGKLRSGKWLWLSMGLIIVIAAAGGGYYLYFHKQSGREAKIASAPPVPVASPETRPGENPVPAPASPGSPPVVPDPAELEKDLNNALLSDGIKGIKGHVSPDLVATLEGTARSRNQKEAALKSARSIQGITDVKSLITIEKPTPAVASSGRTDPAKLEGELNRALRNQGLSGVTAVVSDNLDVKLKGSVGSGNEKERAIAIAGNFRGVGRVRDMIFVVE